MVSPILAPTPPAATGAQQQVVSLLTEALVARGHDVILYATGDSRTSATLKHLRDQAFLSQFPSHSFAGADLFYQHALTEHTLWAAADADKSGCDVLHTHRPAGVFCQRGIGIPQVNTVHHGGPASNAAMRPFYEAYYRFFDHFPNVTFAAVSESQRSAYPSTAAFRVVHNAIDYESFALGSGPGEYLLYLGRITPSKGVHLAIDVALRAGLPLLIAGSASHLQSDRGYFERSVRPKADGEQICYLGEADHATRVALYQGARALINPLQWDEPFGLTMIEAMACGTPVIALRRGAAPEVIEHGVTGFVIDDLDEMVAVVQGLGAPDRPAIRARVMERFSAERMVVGYEAAYRAAIDGFRPCVPGYR